jgi:uncharacterized protein (DUF362 family)/Pyruvate/2-oxoacid:ferredoxin oxidoreductase delta subunit
MRLPTVALVRCESYDQQAVDAAVRKGLHLLGDLSDVFQHGEQILLKPNLLSVKDPDAAVTTHPAVFFAVATALQDMNLTLSYGDSPAVASPRRTAQKAGISSKADRLNIPLADFKQSRDVDASEESLIKRFPIAEGVMQTDGLVSLSKMKTHGFQTLTGAIKNQFGCIPGLVKAEFHARIPDPFDFARMLVDLTKLLQPRLYVLDAITAMEGNGPGSGTPRQMNLLMFSRDPVAMDSTVARLMGVDPATVPVVVWGEKRGLGSAGEIQYAGDPIESFEVSRYDIPPRSDHQRHAFLIKMLRKYAIPRPLIDPHACVSCGQCVTICPAQPKALTESPGKAPHFSSKHCIRCFCCQEICPEAAIRIHMPLPGRLIHR